MALQSHRPTLLSLILHIASSLPPQATPLASILFHRISFIVTLMLSIPYTSFSFFAQNSRGLQSNTVVVTLNVISTDPPTASYSGPTSTNENTQLTITGINVASVDPTQAVSAVISQLPANAALLQTDGTPITQAGTTITDPQNRVYFIPNTNFVGKYLL